MLVSLTPPGQSGAFFGLYALTGKATVWLGPMLVEMFTRGFGSQQMGFLPIAVLLGLGLIGVLFVRAGGRPSGSANE
jgi:UMF1 family MFS transporter